MDRTLALLIVSDILILSGFGLVGPILAIYINGSLIGGSVVAIGIAVGIFWGLKSVLQIPLSKLIDSHKKKIGFLIFGTAIIATVPFIYLMSKNVYHIYAAQVVYAIGASFAYPAWFSLFTIHLNKKHRGLEFSIWSAGVGLGTGISAYLGAEIATRMGFQIVFIIAGISSLLGMLILFFIDRSYEKKLLTFDGLVHKRIKHLKK